MKYVEKGAEIAVKIPALGENEYPFNVSYISVMGDFATWRSSNATQGYDMKTFEVEAKPKAQIVGLRVGMTALLRIK